jgi:Beta-lactamase superfamily domain
MYMALHQRTLFLILASCLFLVYCSPRRAARLRRDWLDQSPQTYTLQRAKPNPDSLLVSYIGCGGYLLQYGGDKLLLDPFFSNLSMTQLNTGNLRPDYALMDAFLQRELGTKTDSTGQISTILISHAHYDHLGDVPFLLQSYLRNPVVTLYGSTTAVNLVRSFGAPVPDTARQLQSLERFFKVHSVTEGQSSDLPVSPFFYLPGGRMRFAAIPSNHAGHYCFFGPHKLPFINGQVLEPPAKPAYFGLKYKEGMNYNYVIDLLDPSGKPVYRIFSNAGAACDRGVGYLPENLLREQPVDLMLLCGANYNVANDFPIPLLNAVQPRVVLMGHWENFFKPVPKIQQNAAVVPNTNIPELLENVQQFADEKGFPEKILIEYPQKRQIKLRF